MKQNDSRMLQTTSAIRPIPRDLPSEYHNPLVYHDSTIYDSEEVELREYWKVLVKYRYLIALTVSCLTVFSLLFAFTVTPRYTASSRIRIGTYEPVLSATKVEDVFQEQSKETHYLETQIQEIRSFSLADIVLKNEQILNGVKTEEKSGFFSFLTGSSSDRIPDEIDQVSGYAHSIRRIRDYLDRIDVTPIRRTSLVSIHATAEDAKLAAIMANEHALQYIEWVRDNRVKQQSRALTFLRKQARELRQSVTEKERAIADYAEKNSIVAVNSDENITAQRMAQLNTLLTETTAKRIEAENQYTKSQESLSQPTAGFDDPSIQTMRSELGKLRGEYGQLLSKFTPEYPRMKELHAQIEGLSSAIQMQRSEIVEGLRAKSESLKIEEDRLKEELEKQKSLTFELAKRQVEYNVLKSEIESSRSLLQDVERQIKESALAVEGKSSNVSIVDYAVTPTAASYPKKSLMLLAGVLLGVGLGIGLAFLLNYLDNTVRTPEDLSQLVRLPSLGVVPSFLSDHSNGAQGRLPLDAENTDSEDRLPIASPQLPPIAFLHDPKSLAAEAYRTIRTGILLSQAGEPPKTVLVTSAQSSEGKTTSAMNLAVSLATAGGSVALIDADLRRPSIGKYFHLPLHIPGVVEIVTGQASVEEVGLSHLVRR
ncbi:MAG: hypothetical protein KDD55_09025, partial [Bdellovibrionales bacterium]|nr:hypothetical protein [Bdellovibrionales bacterium]